MATSSLRKCAVRTTFPISTFQADLIGIDMDNHIGDVHSAIVDKEIEIIQALQENILTFKDTIAKACDICAELDCLLAFAESSRAYNLRRPTMVEDSVTVIKQGRYVVDIPACDI